MDIEKLIDRLYTKQQSYDSYTDSELAHVMEDAITALSTLQAENAQLRAYLEYEQEHANAYYEECGQWEAENEKLLSDLRRLHTERDTLLTANQHLLAEREQLTAERDAAVKAVKNMAEYIVCAGRVDYYLCDEISQEHHLKYQPKNDGNYDNEPCYKCIADWFLQGHVWQENC